jgi:hypothetical protein
MINVIDIYNTVRDLCNKDQKGFVTPEVFSTFAAIAQQNVYNEMFTELALSKKLRRSNVDNSRDKSVYKQVEEDLSYFIYETVLGDASAEGDYIGEEGEMYDPSDDSISVLMKPSNLGKIISIRDNTVAGVRTPLELIYNSEDADRVMNSNLSSPTSAFPVALIAHNIEILPTDINEVVLKYYRIPGSINVNGSVETTLTPAYIQIGATNMADMANSRHFELAPHYSNELIIEIAKMIGIRLRDTFLTTITVNEEKAE